MNKEPVIILGAGPAGLAAAHELAMENIPPIVLEKTSYAGGLARTEIYKGYRFDIGGHRFFTKIEKIHRLWQTLLGDDLLRVPRKSRIYYRGRFIHYPVDLFNTFSSLGMIESFLILSSYIRTQLRPKSPEENFEQWVTNRFGRRLYQTFFQGYTEKVWGIPCHRIQADWAGQRIKGLSFLTVLYNTLMGIPKAKSLIHEFYYPAEGPGMMWERFHEIIRQEGGQVRFNAEAVKLIQEKGSIKNVLLRINGDKIVDIPVRHLISSIPISRLVAFLDPKAPQEVLEAAEHLSYRSLVFVGLIIEKKSLFPDQWLYIHDPGLKVGRIQNFKNWSACMVPDPGKTSIGMEYFCDTGDDIWTLSDGELIRQAARELSELGLAEADYVTDGFVVRQPDAYPVYHPSYDRHLKVIRDFLGTIHNLQTVGRNGMHRYNNMDHAMLTGILAARNVLGEKHNLWEVNEDEVYLEEDKEGRTGQRVREKVLKGAFARIDKLAFAIAVGSVTGLLFFLVTLWPILKGAESMRPYLSLLAQYFIGYTATVKGAFMALGYSFAWGFLLGWLFAYLRNLFLGLYLYRIKKASEWMSLKDFFDYL
ncbi:MAG: NAD(P)/FAD-dependent oxidoreductase [Pseudomonadota bacterium]